MKIKKIIIIFVLFMWITPLFSLADDDTEEVLEYENIPEIVQATSDSVDEPEINSRSAIVYDRNSKEVLYGKEEKTKRKMASTTKIMTATIIIENKNLSDTVTISKKSAGTGGSRLGLKTGDKISVNDLLYGLMLRSGNDTAVALAEYAGGDLNGFADLMNKKAEELDLNDTHFVTPHGLDNDDHYTTALDLAKLTDYALKNDTFRKIVATKSYTVAINGNQKNISNTNELLGNLDGVYGVKTGFTNGANRCLVTATKRESLDIITIVLGADTKKFRTQDSVKLIEYAFKNFEDMNITELINKEFDNWKENNLKKIQINKGVDENIEVKMQSLENSYITIKKNQKESIDININAIYMLDAPVEENTKIGNLILKIGNDKKIQLDILIDKGIRKKDYNDYFKYYMENYFNILAKKSI